MEKNAQLKISIVTPSYNQSKYLPFTIESVLDQQYPNLEYIIIDGGSSDQSIDIIKKYERSLSYWISEPDRGQSDAINKGWKRVHGDIIGYLNSDDLLLPGSLERVAVFFEKNKDVDFIYGNAIFIDESGKKIGRLNGHPFDLRLMLQRKITIPQPAMFFRKNLLDEIGYLDEDFHYTMDVDFCLRTAHHHTLIYLPYDLAAMRVHSEAKTLSMPDLFYLDELSALTKFFSQPHLPEKIKKCKNLAFARSYLRGSDALYKKGQFAESKRIAIEGLQLSLWAILDFRNLILCMSIMTGYDFYQLGVRMKKRIRPLLLIISS